MQQTDTRGATVTESFIQPQLASPNFRLLHHVLDRAAHRAPDAVAVRDRHGAHTYRDLAALSTAVAGWLHERGVRRHDRVAVRATSTHHTVAFLYGCFRLGAVMVPISATAPPPVWEHILRDAAPDVAISDDPEQVDLAGGVCHYLPRIWPEIVAGTGRPPVTSAQPDPTDPALLIYTSGSTALPKAVVCPHSAMMFVLDAIARRLSYRPDDVVLCRLPLSFDYGLYQVMLSAYAEACVVLADGSDDRRLLQVVRTHRVTVVPLVPSLATMLLQLARRDSAPVPVRLFTNTGERLPEETLRALRRRFPGAGVQLMFGTTECKRISIMEVDGDLSRPGSVGQALPGTAMSIRDAAGEPLPAGTPGEVVVHGPHLMTGYWRAPDLTARVFRTDPVTGERRLHTGDFGYLDSDGYLYFEGRRDDVFKLRGTRTSAAEIEAAALTVPGVTAAAVLSPQQGRDAILCVIADAGPTEVLRALRGRLEPAKIPPACHVLRRFPLTGNGKVDRRRLADSLTEGRQ